MSHKKRISLALAIFALLHFTCSFAMADGWSALIEQAESSGVHRQRMEMTVKRLSDAGISPQQASPLFQRAYEAARKGLPAGIILAKIDEGVLKRVGLKAMEKAVNERFRALERAQAVLMEHGYLLSPGKGMGVLVSAAFALESGMNEGALSAIAKRGKDKSHRQLKAVLEAGETLLLSGIDHQSVEALMGDCLERNLNRTEMLRVVRFAQQKKREGLSGASLREALWMSEGNRHGGNVQRRSGPTGTGSRGLPGGMGGSRPHKGNNR